MHSRPIYAALFKLCTLFTGSLSATSTMCRLDVSKVATSTNRGQSPSLSLLALLYWLSFSGGRLTKTSFRSNHFAPITLLGVSRDNDGSWRGVAELICPPACTLLSLYFQLSFQNELLSRNKRERVGRGQRWKIMRLMSR